MLKGKIEETLGIWSVYCGNERHLRFYVIEAETYKPMVRV
jgi:hypothetical protein